MAYKAYQKHFVTATKKASSIGRGHEASDHEFEKGAKVSEHIYKMDEANAAIENAQSHNSGVMLYEITEPEPAHVIGVESQPLVTEPVV